MNTRLVAALNTAGVAAVGLTGADARCGLSRRAAPHTSADGRTVDLGRVGVPIDQSDARLLNTLLAGGFIPVVASIGIGEDGQLYNVNADTVAAALAKELHAGKLLLLTDVPGVRDGQGQFQSRLTVDQAEALCREGVASDGMIPKLKAACVAARAGVTVHIVDGHQPHSILLELLTEAGVGTMIDAWAADG